MNRTYNKYCWLSMLGLLTTLNSAIAANASDKEFPTQLSVSLNNPIHVSRNDPSREYTFKAPDNKTLIDRGQLTAVGSYKVEVYGSEQELLNKVRDIEPKAFIKDDIIQVGIFTRQDNAEDMARKLAKVGLWARIIAQ